MCPHEGVRTRVLARDSRGSSVRPLTLGCYLLSPAFYLLSTMELLCLDPCSLLRFDSEIARSHRVSCLSSSPSPSSSTPPDCFAASGPLPFSFSWSGPFLPHSSSSLAWHPRFIISFFKVLLIFILEGVRLHRGGAKGETLQQAPRGAQSPGQGSAHDLSWNQEPVAQPTQPPGVLITVWLTVSLVPWMTCLLTVRSGCPGKLRLEWTHSPSFSFLCSSS